MKKLLILSILLAACGGDDAPATSISSDVGVDAAALDTDGAPGDSAQAPSASPLLAARVTSVEDLIGGDGAYGQVERAWILENSVARFLIQDIDVSVGLNLYGGNLIDADVVRPDGSKGQDQFREIFPSAGFLVLAPESISVIEDGSNGERAILRVEGALNAQDRSLSVAPILDHGDRLGSQDEKARAREDLTAVRSSRARAFSSWLPSRSP